MTSPRAEGIEGLIETALGLQNLRETTRSSDRLEALIVGPADLAASLAFPPAVEAAGDSDRWHFVRMTVLVAARAAGLDAIDGPHLQLDRAQAVLAALGEAEARRSSGAAAPSDDRFPIVSEDKPPPDEQTEERSGAPRPPTPPAPPPDGDPRLVNAARLARRVLPGDSSLGDPMSSSGDDSPSNQLARRLAEQGERSEKPSVMRELGLGALQAWQALSESQGRGRGEVDLAIMFCDLVDFSSWALEAGDEAALKLLREFKHAVEASIIDHDGELVKLLGDGAMSVFRDGRPAVDAAHAAIGAVAEIEVAGYRPQLRAGVHLGRPRKVSRDYVGVDVNVAARVCEAAGAGELLVSAGIEEGLPASAYKTKRRRFFRAKGAPKDLEVYSAETLG